MSHDIGSTAIRILRLMAKSLAVCRKLSLGIAILVTCPIAALSQVAPSQVTPQTLQPAAPSVPESPPALDSSQLQAPPGSEHLSILVGRVVINGVFPELEAETRALVQGIQGHRATVAQIYEFANALEQAYARAGYVLVRVTVPSQKLNDRGPVRLVIVDGFVEKIQVDNVPDRVRALVIARVASLVGRRHIKLDEIERRLLTAGDAPGLRLKSVLARGKTPGGVLLVLEGTHKLVTAEATIDNGLPSSLGTWRYGTSVALNSAFGFGEQFYASAQSSGDPARILDYPPLRVLGAGAVLPIGMDGWILNPEFTYSRSQPELVTGGVANIGEFQRFALRTSYPVIRTRTKTLSLNGAFEYISQHVYLPLFTTDLNRDRYGVIRAGAAYDTGLPWGSAVLQTSATFSQGTGGRDSADGLATGIPLSRQGADPRFSKANFDAHVAQPLPEQFRLDLIGRAQTSFGNPLLVPEQFSLDGPQAVSSYPTGTLNVDEGVTLRGELSRPFLIEAVPVILEPYGFASFGVGRLIEPTAVELAVVRGGALGVGLRSGIDVPGGYEGVTLGVEAARQFSNLPDLSDSWRAQFILNIRF